MKVVNLVWEYLMGEKGLLELFQFRGGEDQNEFTCMVMLINLANKIGFDLEQKLRVGMYKYTLM